MDGQGSDGARAGVGDCRALRHCCDVEVIDDVLRAWEYVERTEFEEFKSTSGGS